MTPNLPAQGPDRRRRPSHRALATVLLVLITAVWGSTFFMIHDLMQTLPAADFLAVRFAIAAVLMLVIFWRQVRALTRREWGIGLGLGVLYGVAQVLQTMGLAHTDASRSGFITGMYVVLTPVFAARLLRDRVSPATWGAVGLATLGLGALSLQGVGPGFGYGETLTLVGAAIYALHIVGLGRYSTAASATGLATVQIIMVALLCTIAALPDGISMPRSGSGWLALLYMASIAGAGAMWAQTWAQAHLTAARAAIVMTLEPVFAAFFAVLLGGESVTVRMLLGGGLILAAMYLVELTGRRPDEPGHERTALEEPPAEALHHEG
ncbi:DMT family transporter [Arsenicicoccus piscis]|uniref:Transporter n=1 Tax=Arsenicicoccus piscis TaxID=673954 RepID=A0ABQ6HLT9_9MICO|nr:DMT family transporter [Arsenicicoccus piscis]MCH8628632.1 DMT family transporter [Arsenicicoccus piscis]GMA19436.1 transporter [Arsenicicoccus piscis]